MKECKELDVWIEQLNDCKQLSENQVKTLCEKVTFSSANTAFAMSRIFIGFGLQVEENECWIDCISTLISILVY